MLTLVWGEEALDDLTEILDYIEIRSVPAAANLNQTIRNCAHLISQHPYLYRQGRLAGTREAVAHPNYILVYRVGIETVEIVSVVHARQRYP